MAVKRNNFISIIGVLAAAAVLLLAIFNTNSFNHFSTAEVFAAKAAGESCTQDSECESKNCHCGGPCVKDGQVVGKCTGQASAGNNLPEGASCTSDNQCASGNCHTGGSASGKCTAKAGSAAACNSCGGPGQPCCDPGNLCEPGGSGGKGSKCAQGLNCGSDNRCSSPANQGVNQSNTQTNTQTQTNNQVQQVVAQGGSASAQGGSSTVHVTTGSVTQNAPTAPRREVRGVSQARPVQVQAQELPKTGLPLLAYAAAAFLPLGASLVRTGKVSGATWHNPQYILEQRKFRQQHH